MEPAPATTCCASDAASAAKCEEACASVETPAATAMTAATTKATPPEWCQSTAAASVHASTAPVLTAARLFTADMLMAVGPDRRNSAGNVDGVIEYMIRRLNVLTQRLKAGVGDLDRDYVEGELRTVCRCIAGQFTDDRLSGSARDAFMRAKGLEDVADLLDQHLPLPAEAIHAVVRVLRYCVEEQGVGYVDVAHMDQCVRVAGSLAKAAIACRWGARLQTVAAEEAFSAARNLTSYCSVASAVPELADWMASSLVRLCNHAGTPEIVANLVTASSVDAARRNAWTLDRTGAFEKLRITYLYTNDAMCGHAARALHAALLICDSTAGDGGETLWRRWLGSGFAARVLAKTASLKDVSGPHAIHCATLHGELEKRFACERANATKVAAAERAAELDRMRLEYAEAAEAKHAAELERVRAECVAAARMQLEAADAKHAAELERVRAECHAEGERKVRGMILAVQQIFDSAAVAAP